MTNVSIGVLSVFNHESQDWTSFKGRLEQWFQANDINDGVDKSSAKRRAILLSSLSETTYRLIKDLALPKDVGTLSFKEVTDLLDGHFKIKTCSFAERFKFHSAIQSPSESLAEWSARVRGLAKDCDFPSTSLDYTLRDRFVLGLATGPERDRLFTEPMENLTLQKALQIADGVRCAREGSRQVPGGSMPQTILDVHKMAAGSGATGSGRRPPPPFSSSSMSSHHLEQCSVCGYSGHNSNKCRFKNAVCRKCNVKGHMKRVCDSRKSESVKVQNFLQCCSDESGDGKRILLFNIRTYQGEPMYETITINNTKLSFEIDTGSAVTAISENIYDKYFSTYKLKASKNILQSYNGSVIKVLGIISLPFSYQSRSENLDVYVVQNGGAPLLGRDFIRKFNLQICPVNNCELSDDISTLKMHYKNLFSDNLGCCKNFEVKLNLKPNLSPFYCKARPVPFAIRPKLEEEIDRLTELGIIEPVTFSEYASPIVPVLRKDGKIRLCADYSGTLNKQLLVDKYPLPRLEELFTKLHNGVTFTKLDLSGAYNQLKLCKDSQNLTCINTHKGLFKFKRLVFGLSSAPAIFQRTLENILTAPDEHGHPSPLQEGVLQFLDDILITGKTRTEHLSRLREVFLRLEKAGLVLKEEKCSFFQDSVSYLGFIIDKNGIHKCPDKVNTILNAKKPENVSELKSFLGLVNYYRVFIKNASSILSPLHELLQKNVKWKWLKEQDLAFNSIKRDLSSDNTLAHFNQDARIILTVDASPWGLGAVLSQIDESGIEKPVSYASRSLNAAEKQYSQIQKEATAIIFGVRKYHQYLYGRSDPFVLRTDHKPLLSIFNPQKGVPEVSANRLQRYALFLTAYNYIIEFVNSASNCADYFSRSMTSINNSSTEAVQTIGTQPVLSPPPSSLIDKDFDEPCYVNFIFNAKSPLITLADVQKATMLDKVISLVCSYTINGWPDKITDNDFRIFFCCRYDLSVEKGCLMKGHRLVVPTSLRASVVAELHSGHLGVVKMKSEARARFWWAGMSAAIERAVAACEVCTQLRPAPRRAPLTPWPFPPEPWYRVHLDFLGPLNGKMYLVTVDAFSKWVEVYDVSSGYGSKVVIQKMCDLMARFGLFKTICTDNGTSFVSSEFKYFCESNGIEHLTSPQYHPASNGQAESYVKIIKKAIKGIILNNNISDLNVKLNEFLFNYRNSEHSTTNKSPAEVLFGKKLRSRLDLMCPNLASSSDTALSENVKENQCLQARYYKGYRNINFNINDVVLVKVNDNVKSLWVKGTILKKLGNSAYLIRLGKDGRIIKRHKNQIYECKGEGDVMKNDEQSTSNLQIPLQERQQVTIMLPSGTRKQLPESVVKKVTAPPVTVQTNINLPHEDTISLAQEIISKRIPPSIPDSPSEGQAGQDCQDTDITSLASASEATTSDVVPADAQPPVSRSLRSRKRQVYSKLF